MFSIQNIECSGPVDFRFHSRNRLAKVDCSKLFQVAGTPICSPNLSPFLVAYHETPLPLVLREILRFLIPAHIPRILATLLLVLHVRFQRSAVEAAWTHLNSWLPHAARLLRPSTLQCFLYSVTGLAYIVRKETSISIGSGNLL